MESTSRAQQYSKMNNLTTYGTAIEFRCKQSMSDEDDHISKHPTATTDSAFPPPPLHMNDGENEGWGRSRWYPFTSPHFLRCSLLSLSGARRGNRGEASTGHRGCYQIEVQYSTTPWHRRWHNNNKWDDGIDWIEPPEAGWGFCQ